MNATDRQGYRTKVTRCIGCGLPLLGFATAPFVDRFGDVYHSIGCYELCEREMAELATLDEPAE